MQALGRAAKVQFFSYCEKRSCSIDLHRFEDTGVAENPPGAWLDGGGVRGRAPTIGRMNCPTDGTTLLMSERNGIEIDYCPECRGIWLDRGELDKILERVQPEGSVAAPAQRAAAPQGYSEPRYEERRDQRYDERRDSKYVDPRYRKKKSPFEFLGDLFE